MLQGGHFFTGSSLVHRDYYVLAKLVAVKITDVGGVS